MSWNYYRGQCSNTSSPFFKISSKTRFVKNKVKFQHCYSKMFWLTANWIHCKCSIVLGRRPEICFTISNVCFSFLTYFTSSEMDEKRTSDVEFHHGYEVISVSTWVGGRKGESKSKQGGIWFAFVLPTCTRVWLMVQLGRRVFLRRY